MHHHNPIVIHQDLKPQNILVSASYSLAQYHAVLISHTCTQIALHIHVGYGGPYRSENM